ncbi:MAG: MFS transporter [Xanthomonadales bacterium]|nr:MFS transporter [Xanthomonadales bacterium]
MNLANQIDHNPMTRYQMRAIAVCMLINMLDGFDVLVVAFTAASIAADWDLSATAIGSLLSAGLVGMTVGSLVLGPLADRFGRRPLVLVCLVVMTVGMLLSAFTENVEQLTATRLLTGLGIGGMLPSLNTIVAEYSSLRWRSFSVSILQAGYPVGATLGGLIAAIVISQYGWRSVYALAGLASALMVLVVWRALPESLDYLASRQPLNALDKINDLLRKLGRESISALPELANRDGKKKSGYADMLATPGLWKTSLLLSLAFFIVMFSFYFVLSWTPKILVDAGMSTSQGISGGVLLNMGGIVGSLLLGYVSSRLDISKLIAVYMVLSAALMAVFANVSSFDITLQMLALALGFFIFGSMVGLYALAPHLYPVQSRSAGLSIAIGIGRIGGVTSPLLAGYLFDHGWAQADGFIMFAIPLLLAAVVVIALKAKPVKTP